MQKNSLQISEDRVLVDRMLAGESEAFEEFFESTFDSIFRFALTRLGNDEALAGEIAQATVCKAIEKIETYRAQAALFTWMCTICRWEISAHFRRLKRSPEEIQLAEESLDAVAVVAAMDAGPPTPEQDMQRRGISHRVHSTLDQLPTRYGRALEWKYLDGLSVKEIAERLGLSAKATESVLTRARQAFRSGFEAVAEIRSLRRIRSTQEGSVV